MSVTETNSERVLKSKQKSLAPQKCLHCGLLFRPTREKSDFCCLGCKHVYHYIQTSSLGYYYDIREKSQNTIPMSETGTSVNLESMIPKDYFEDPEFQKKFCQQDGNHMLVRLTIPDLTCYACVWLCEKAIQKEVPNSRIQINLTEKSANLWLDNPSTEIGQVVTVLHSLGLRVFPGTDVELLKEKRRSRMRLGIAILCTINIMSFAFAEYVDLPLFAGKQSSLSFEWRQIFRWLQGILYVPVLLYSAAPFFRSAFASILSRQTNIDLPIALSLMLTSFYSYSSLFLQGSIYFDSLAMGVSLLLVGRKILEIHVQRGMNQIKSAWMKGDEWLRRVREDGSTQPVSIHSVKIGDLIKVLPGEILSLAGTIIEGRSFFSTERINGEMKPVFWEKGDHVLEQAICLDSMVTVKVNQDGSSGFMQRAQRSIDKLQLEKASWALKFERIASVFFIGVCLTAFSVLFYLGFNTEGVHRALSIILIACPCAFGLAIPLSFASSMALAWRAGLVFKSQHAFEKLSKAKCFVFDKTGTLTLGKFTITESSKNFLLFDAGKFEEDFHLILYEVSKISMHPLMQTVHSFYLEHPKLIQTVPLEVLEVKETLGQGIEVNYNSEVWRFGNQKFCDLAENYCQENGFQDLHGFFIMKNRKFVSFISFLDELDSGTSSLFEYLQSIGAKSFILSGDTSNHVEDLSKVLKVDILGKGCTPEEKMNKLQTCFDQMTTVMIGNGVNDSYALAKSHVGVAVYQASEAAKRSADVILSSSGMFSLVSAIRIAKLSRRKILATCLFASLYNVVGIVLAACGYIQPLFAALLMPLSSLVIVWISSQSFENIFSVRLDK